MINLPHRCAILHKSIHVQFKLHFVIHIYNVGRVALTLYKPL